ncbi:helix-turn-helix domain-containing protein [Undibacterium sp. RTI2.1]|uniref:helix-turn-helix domain-containing protein n=1 Tax=unclassified Undibacterium TaxID=2630295 RepID=UPI002AB3C468|nr:MULTISPECIES: helix-turn-helix domain-containing protein [unclassified Undibacterium]MDY7539687.1 helix-turn-helix domain-containing protein [Undibacterium sp. 5I1]MEB0030704.1 helix-turn-helix domain-containing protein [Undibacterium sp. RTI2.1]MEB0117177.1 helix-turn-helix domain-containing protein [Undibacterium sp. RTI2.2]MEB0230883.1 helix-turn-helix domain-containing protein [Undibacterium sp. 10I3]MEB0257462.1 helix-turn-helix domain-containing protein [Undibacterium sp. 5I1]
MSNTDPLAQTQIQNQESPKPRGVLRRTLNQGEFQHHRQLPSAELADVIEHYWHVSWDLRGLPAQEQATLPHPNVHLVIEQGQARIYGVHSHRFIRQLAEQDQVFGIKFKAGGFYPFYRQALASLHNRSIDLTTCFGQSSADFAGQISVADNFLAKCAIAENFLLAHLPPSDPQVLQVSQLVASIEQNHSITTVDDLLRINDLDKRSLQRLFQKYVGVGPKWVIQRYRLHEAIAQIQEGKTLNWIALALELGYFDQAHFGRDFRALVGMTPAEYEKSLV